MSAFIKRVRSRFEGRRVRFFGCGEYGESRGRPHYHVILFGLGEGDEHEIRACWSAGIVQVDRLEPAAIAYVAGYTAKKLGHHEKVERGDRVDQETGEVLEENAVLYQPPFLLMSRRPGIGGDARKYWRSWAKTAIWDGAQVRVPRYLHEAFKANATEARLEALKREKDAYLASVGLDSKLRERAGEAIAKAKLNLRRRQKL